MVNKTVVIIALGLSLVGTIGVVLSDSEHAYGHREGEYEAKHEREHAWGGWVRSKEDVAPVRSRTYQSECSGCHFAYQPGLLSADAWTSVMASLEDHYGDDATLAPEAAKEIRVYLTENAADRSGLSRSRAFAQGGRKSEGLARITETDYFRREHHEIPTRLVKGNEGVGSFANCQACHRGADSGVYNEHQVIIPGVGRWDD